MWLAKFKNRDKSIIKRRTSSEAPHDMPINDDYRSRMRFLQATQLYRFLNDKHCERVGRVGWHPEINEDHHLHMPYCTPEDNVDNIEELFPLIEKAAPGNAVTEQNNITSGTIPVDDSDLGRSKGLMR
jgi:hypothetical protein